MAAVTETEAQEIIKKLARQYAIVFNGVKADAKKLPKDKFVLQNLNKAKMVGPFIGRPGITDTDAQLVLSIGWDMIQKGEV